jgi:hypothetical protein
MSFHVQDMSPDTCPSCSGHVFGIISLFLQKYLRTHTVPCSGNVSRNISFDIPEMSPDTYISMFRKCPRKHILPCFGHVSGNIYFHVSDMSQEICLSMFWKHLWRHVSPCYGSIVHIYVRRISFIPSQWNYLWRGLYAFIVLPLSCPFSLHLLHVRKKSPSRHRVAHEFRKNFRDRPTSGGP